MQLEILTLTFKKIVSYTIAGPGVALGCIQTQMVARGALAEMLCLGVNSPTSAPTRDRANGSCGQQQLEGHTPSAEHNLTSSLFLFLFFLLVLKDASYPREHAFKEMHTGT